MRLLSGSASPPPPAAVANFTNGGDSVKLWGVTTTIFDPTPACKIFADGIGNVVTKLVVVGDKKTPNRPWNEFAHASRRVVYLSPSDQLALKYESIKLLPWNHFGRKNIGFLFAIAKGAEWIFDFDDDNVLNAEAARIVPHVLLGTERSVALVESDIHLYNPYPDFRPRLQEPETGETGHNTFIWPRGFPLDFIRNNRTYNRPARVALDEQRVQVFQSLADNNPDVDAIYRMTRNLPVTFKHTGHVRALPSGTFAPFNAQATLFRRGAMWGLLLPVTVHDRVSDIWRSYIVERLLWESNSTAAFTSSWVTQYRNPHSYQQDFDHESDVYTKVSALLRSLAGWTSSKGQSFGDAYVQIMERLHAASFIQQVDVELAKAWVADLTAAGYEWPKLSTPQMARQLEAAALVDERHNHLLDAPPPPPPPLSMAELFLDPYRQIPGVDVVFSIRSTGDNGPLHNRDFYNAWLSLWPLGLGSLIHYAEDLPIYTRFNECLQKAPCAALPFRSAKFDYYAHLGRAQSFRSNSADREANDWFAAQMNVWKFDADRVASAPIIAFTDDDSCMLDHVLPSEIVTAEGKLVARGRYAQTYMLKEQKDEHDRLHQAIGVPSFVADFMLEFPVYVWSEMLPDFRAHVIKHVLPSATQSDLPTFWTAIGKLLTDRLTVRRRDSGVHWTPQEYSNMLNFAYHSPKWHDKYEWQLVGDPKLTYPLLSHAVHPRARGCPVPASTVRNRDIEQFSQKSLKGLLYPSELTVSREDRAKPPYGPYVSSWENAPVWINYTLQRQMTLRTYAEGRKVSAIEACPAIRDHWRQCFDQMGRKTGVPYKNIQPLRRSA